MFFPTPTLFSVFHKMLLCVLFPIRNNTVSSYLSNVSKHNIFRIIWQELVEYLEFIETKFIDNLTVH